MTWDRGEGREGEVWQSAAGNARGQAVLPANAGSLSHRGRNGLQSRPNDCDRLRQVLYDVCLNKACCAGHRG